MTVHRVRDEWIGDKRVLAGAVEEPATLVNFAGAETATVLAVEPRLVALAGLVIMAARGGGVAEDVWRGVDGLAGVFVGPGRSVAQVTPISATSVAVTSTLVGEVTRRRFLAALRARAAEEAAR